MMRDGMIPIKAGVHPIGEGTLAIHGFPNGYSASVIRNSYSYGGSEGLYEIAVLHGGSLCYASPITGDVLGFLTEGDVIDTLNKIADLPPNQECTHVASS